MQVRIEIPADRIAELMCSAVESGDPVTNASKGGWCAGIWPMGGSLKRAKAFTHWYAESDFWKNGFLIDIFEIVDETKEWNVERKQNVTAHRINPARMAKGFAVMAVKFPHAFAQILQDDTDAPCADAFLQALCFGEEKYG